MANQGKGVATEIDIVRYIVKDLIESYAKERYYLKGLFKYLDIARAKAELIRNLYMNRRKVYSSST